MKVHDLNEEMLNELNLQDIKDGAKKVATATKETVGGAIKVAKDEWNDNVKAFQIFIRKFKGHQVEESEFKAALDQVLKDNAKLLLVAGIGVSPGSAITLPIAINIAKKFGVNLIPSKTFD